jgi:uncharacterized SAM-binding protein YcdF (DUF218 family)
VKGGRHKLWKVLKTLLVALGVVFMLQVLLALTPLPFHVWYRMGMRYSGISRPPDYIVVLGGGGMPSESGLMRCWYAAKAGSYFPGSKILIALPGDTADSLSSVSGMKNELILRGIEPERILFEDSGTNTRAQALNILRITSPPVPLSFRRGGAAGEAGILLITSPEHLYRAFLTFKKAGFIKVDGVPAFEEAIEADITYQGKRLGGRHWVPDIGESITIRYGFWTQLRYEALILREWLALGYYWVKGWI